MQDGSLGAEGGEFWKNQEGHIKKWHSDDKAGLAA